MKWYHKAAEQNHAAAQTSLGRCYTNGQGVKKDYVEAVKWYSPAQFALGCIYSLGQGMHQDCINYYKRLLESLQKEITAVTESLKELRASPDYELCQLAEQKPGVLDELAAERAKQLEVENAELEKQAEQLAEKIKRLDGTEKFA